MAGIQCASVFSAALGSSTSRYIISMHITVLHTQWLDSDSDSGGILACLTGPTSPSLNVIFDRRTDADVARYRASFQRCGFLARMGPCCAITPRLDVRGRRRIFLFRFVFHLVSCNSTRSASLARPKYRICPQVQVTYLSSLWENIGTAWDNMNPFPLPVLPVSADV